MSAFVRADTIPASDQIVASIWGVPKSGKTTFVVGSEAGEVPSWPLPIYFFNYDQSLTELLPFVAAEVKQSLYTIDLVAETAIEPHAQAAMRLKRAEDAITEATTEIRKTGKGTICIDTMSQHWQLVQKVELSAIHAKRVAAGKELFPFDYGEANQRYRNFVLQLKLSRGNIALMHHASEEYGDKGQPTGRFRPQQNHHTDGLVTCRLQTYASVTSYGVTYGGIINFVRNRGTIRNLDVPELNYPKLQQLILEGPPDDD